MKLQAFKQKVIAFLKDEEGLTTVEYAIAGGLIGLAVVGAFRTLGTTVGTEINAINTAIAS